MKPLIYLFFLVVVLFSCKETIYVESPPQMQISVISKYMVPVEGATVTLFGTEDEYILNENPLKSIQTDKSGLVLFENLEEQRYYFSITKDGLDNSGDITATWNSLQTGQRFELTVKIAEPISH